MLAAKPKETAGRRQRARPTSAPRTCAAAIQTLPLEPARWRLGCLGCGGRRQDQRSLRGAHQQRRRPTTAPETLRRLSQRRARVVRAAAAAAQYSRPLDHDESRPRPRRWTVERCLCAGRSGGAHCRRRPQESPLAAPPLFFQLQLLLLLLLLQRPPRQLRLPRARRPSSCRASPWRGARGPGSAGPCASS
jgi:hypothetical protein